MKAPIPPLAPDQLLTLLLQLSSLLLIGLCLVRLAARFGLPAIVGEMLAGVVLGPSLLGHLAPGFSGWLLPQRAEQVHLLDAIAQLGVLLLVGVAGMHLDVQLLRRRGTTAAWVSFCGVTIPLAFGLGLGLLAPESLVPDKHPRAVFALFLGVAMCVTAIPVIAKTLADMRLTHRDVGQLILTSATIDDSIGWFLLSVVSAMATIGLHAGRVTLSVLYLFGFAILAMLVGRPLVRYLLRLTQRTGEQSVTITAVVVIVLTGGVITHSLGLEAVFGAFIAGILVGSPGTVDKRALAPLRTVVLCVLAPIFLATAGLRMDLTLLRDPKVALAAVVVVSVAILGKFTGAFIGARLSGMGKWEALAIGSGMNSRGVVEIVVAMVGLRLGVLDGASFTIIALVAILTSVMAPPLLRFAMLRVAHNADELLRKEDHERWLTDTGQPDDQSTAARHPSDQPAVA